MPDRPRIICLGPNKTGTKSLDRFFKANGVRSRSMGGPYPSGNLARRMLRNLAAARPVLHGMDGAEALSDINWLDGRTILNESVFLERLVIENPDSYFIYNDRPVEEWIASRVAHHGGRELRNYMRCYNVDRDQAIAMWREYHSSHRRRASEAIERIGGKFLVFRVGHDDPQILVDYLSESYKLDASLFGWHRESSEDSMRKRLRRLRARFFWSP
ncbi:MAG: sulfotransferase [Candidatus Wenzhouxiangella sp. M2_3B_020]